MHFIAKLAVLTLVPITPVLAATSQTSVFDVQNMTCSLCPVTVKKALQKIPGVEDTKVDFDHKTATVKYDPAKADTAVLVRAITAAGFPATTHK